MIAPRESVNMCAMEVDLRGVFSNEREAIDGLDLFISHRLFEAGVWKSPRTSDGITRVRVVESEPERMSICGRIYSIDQELHSFWLDLERDALGDFVSWALFFDVVADSPRRARDAIDCYDHANEIDWRVTLTGPSATSRWHPRGDLMDVHDFDFDKYVVQARERVLRLATSASELRLTYAPPLVKTLADALQHGLDRLNQLPRTHPFWGGRNALPTTHKLIEFAKASDEVDVELALASLAIELCDGRPSLVRNPLWEVPAARTLPIEWLIETGWIFFSSSGQALSLAPVARRLGREAEYKEILEHLSKSDAEPVRIWSRKELGS